METVCCVVDHERIMKHVYELMSGAKDSIYISTPLIDWTSSCGASDSMLDLIQGICTNGVQVNILVQEDGIILSPTGKATKTLPKLPLKCSVRIVKNFGPVLKDQLLAWTPTLVKILEDNKTDERVDDVLSMVEKGIYRHNQSYILVDSLILVVGSFMFYAPPAQPHCVVSIGRTNSRFVDYAKANWASTTSSMSSTKMTTAKDGITGTIQTGVNTELDLICRWIDEADHYCYIESPLLLSHHETKNKVAEHIVKRLLRAHKNQESDDFRCIILVNTEHIMSTPFENQSYIGEKLNYTLEYITSEIKKASISPALLKNRIFIGRLEDRCIYSTIFIQDGKRCILTSSSICDRSLMSQNTELGVIIGDVERIQNLEQILWTKHTSAHDVDNFSTFFNSCIAEEGHVRKHTLWRDIVVSNSYKIRDFLLQNLIGLSYFT
jgi:hypothetical protein